MVQNTSHAVMQQRQPTDKDELDNYPTPPWAVRALVERVLDVEGNQYNMHSVLEPACGDGYMARTLGEYFSKVTAYDVAGYGYSNALVCRDFTQSNSSTKYDWVITNPPFNQAEKFITKSLSIATYGVAMLVRSAFLESVGRYERLFSLTPPNVVAQFAERVPMVKGRLDPKASTATAYCWLVWYLERPRARQSLSFMQWIEPCRYELEEAADYTIPRKRL